jgi:hypothetical protein
MKLKYTNENGPFDVLLGIFKFFFAAWVLYGAACALLAVAVVYVVVHFILKFW